MYGKDTNEYFAIEDEIQNYIKTAFDNIWKEYFFNVASNVAGMLIPAAIGSVHKGICKGAFTSLTNALKHSDETFSSMVMRKVKEKGMSDVACYKAANLNRQIFSKIRSSAGEKENDSYQPNKNTALSLAIALKLSVDESYELLKKAGYTFSKSNKTDIIVEYCLKNNIKDINKVNEILYFYNQPILGSKSF